MTQPDEDTKEHPAYSLPTEPPAEAEPSAAADAVEPPAVAEPPATSEATAAAEPPAAPPTVEPKNTPQLSTIATSAMPMMRMNF